MSVIMNPRRYGGICPLGLLRHGKKIKKMPIPVAARSKACVYGHSLAGTVRLNPAGAWMYVMSVLSGRGLYNTCFFLRRVDRPSRAYRVWCV